MATKGPASDRELDALFDSVFVSPELYLQSFDLEAKSLSFTPMTAETYRSSSFLDQRIHKAQPVDARVDMLPFLETYERFRPEPRPVGFIFHTAFCCSTLLARCLQELRDTLVLKEPVPLRVLSRHWFDPSTEDLCRRMGDLLAVLLSRRFAGEAVVVKATSFCNNIMPELMDMHEGNRAVFIYSDLEESVASFLKSPASRREARAFLAIMQNLLPPDMPLAECRQLTDAQVAALLWALQMAVYSELATRRYRGRLGALNCNGLLDDPATTLVSVARHLGIECRAAEVDAVLSGSAFTLHAKGRDRAFSRDDRRADMDRLAERYAGEIRVASEWVRGLPLWRRVHGSPPAPIGAGAAVKNRS